MSCVVMPGRLPDLLERRRQRLEVALVFVAAGEPMVTRPGEEQDLSSASAEAPGATLASASSRNPQSRENRSPRMATC
jgi:hypothetical protein